MIRVALIPARGGSKRLANKNLARLAGQPMLAYTIAAALGSEQFDRVLVSTDDVRIAEVAERFGAEVPFLRPQRLATDHTPMMPVIEHALEQVGLWESIESGWFTLLQPTSPLRTAKHIVEAIDHAEDQAAEAVISVMPMKKHPRHLCQLDEADRLNMYDVQFDENVQRQHLPDIYALNGAIFGIRLPVLRAHRSLHPPHTVGYVMDPSFSIDIDDPLDLQRAELQLQDHPIDLPLIHA